MAFFGVYYSSSNHDHTRSTMIHYLTADVHLHCLDLRREKTAVQKIKLLLKLNYKTKF